MNISVLVSYRKFSSGNKKNGCVLFFDGSNCTFYAADRIMVGESKCSEIFFDCLFDKF